MDDVIERIARHLRRPVQIDPALDGRVMREVNARPTHAGAPALRRAWGWLRRPHQLTLTPLGGLAAAAVLAIVILLSRMGSTPPAPPLAESRAFQFVLVAHRRRWLVRPTCTGAALPLLVAMVVAGRATAQQGDSRLERLDAATRPTVAALVDSARTAMLPTEPLVQRALEGATKRASGDAIVAAVRRLAADLGHARDALGSTASPAELTAGAAALRAGASQATLAQLRHARGESLTVPLAVLADLVASG